MTAIQERPQSSDLPTVSLGGLTMPEMVVSLRAVQELPDDLPGYPFDRDTVQGTSEVLAENVRRVSAKACEHVVKTDFSAFQEPDCALYFNTVNTTVDFSATSVLRFPDDEMPTIVMPEQVSIADLPLQTDILFVQPHPPAERQHIPVEDDLEASVVMSGNGSSAEGRETPSLQERLASETENLSLQPLNAEQQRVVRTALKRVIRDGSDAYESAAATAAMSIPALTGVPDPRRTRQQTIGPAVEKEVRWTERAKEALTRILPVVGRRTQRNSGLLQ